MYPTETLSGRKCLPKSKAAEQVRSAASCPTGCFIQQHSVNVSRHRRCGQLMRAVRWHGKLVGEPRAVLRPASLRRNGIPLHCRELARILRATRSGTRAMCDLMRAHAIQCNTPNPHFESIQFPRRMYLYHFCIKAALYNFRDRSSKLFILYGELAGNRTQDPRLKRRY